MGCSEKATKMLKCKTCRDTFEADVYYCNQACLRAKWTQHKETHGLLALLRGIRDAAGNKQREQKLRELLNWVVAEKFWIGETVSKKKDTKFVTNAHLQMLCNIREDPLQNDRMQRMALDAVASLLPFSKYTYNITMNDDAQKQGVFPSLVSAQWLYRGAVNGLNAFVSGRRALQVTPTCTDARSSAVWPFLDTGFDMGGNWHGLCAHRDVGEVYDGEWRNGKPHGQGQYVYADGDVYEGEWLNGKRHGQGNHIGIAGQTYSGEWRCGRAQGTGIMRHADGETYEGQIADGMKQGKGKAMHPNGEIYDGEWLAGHAHGKGQKKYADGASYDGEFADGRAHGHGTYISAAGETYEGEWRNGNMSLDDD